MPTDTVSESILWGSTVVSTISSSPAATADVVPSLPGTILGEWLAGAVGKADLLLNLGIDDRSKVKRSQRYNTYHYNISLLNTDAWPKSHMSQSQDGKYGGSIRPGWKRGGVYLLPERQGPTPGRDFGILTASFQLTACSSKGIWCWIIADL